MNSSNPLLRVVLFDVGGVLVKLSGVPTMVEWLGGTLSAQELLRRWLTSPAVRAFESGRTTPEVFADQLIAEMGLPVDRETFLATFQGWAVELFPDALDLVHRVPRRYTRATLCNSNVVHWARLMQDARMAGAFDHHFASHLIGKIKPDAEAFLHVTRALHCAPGEVLFLDDNRLNIEAAQKIGMKAVQVNGVVAAGRALAEAGVIEA